MAPSTMQESVTVTGEAPLVDTATSTLGGNIDPRQMQELPINGRNWMDLAILAPGSRQNEASNIPQSRQGYSQINIDGQQITHLIPGTDQNQPSYSMDAIAEFVLVTNRFDATQGRSAGMHRQRRHEVGHEQLAGTISGFFRSDRFNAGRLHPEPRAAVLEPADERHVRRSDPSATAPHFFVNYEVEREPRTSPSRARSRPSTSTSSRTTGRAKAWRASTRSSRRRRTSRRGSRTTTSTSRSAAPAAHEPSVDGAPGTALQRPALLDAHAGAEQPRRQRDRRAASRSTTTRAIRTSRGRAAVFPDAPVGCGGSVTISFRGYSIGSAVGQHQYQNNYSMRDDLSMSFSKGGTP